MLDSMYNEIDEFTSEISDSTDEDDFLLPPPTVTAKTVMRWHRQFRDNGNKFLNPARIRRKNKELPPMLDNYIELRKNLMNYANENIKNLSAELLHDYLHKIALPVALRERRDELGLKETEFTMKDFLMENKLKTLSLSTVTRWMHILGYSYSERKRNYYVDGHESPLNIIQRRKFIKDYHEFELNSHRWIQLTKEDFEKIIRNSGVEPKSDGYAYLDEEDNEMMEFHVDSHPWFQKHFDYYSLGGNLSVRKHPEAKPLVIFGQDESIFKQWKFSLKAWKTPRGATQLMPKDDGQGTMVSAFCSREFGFGLCQDLINENLEKINKRRTTTHRTYSDENAAKELNGNILKKKFEIGYSPFVLEFDYGSGNEGYWCYNNMAIQFEDCIDCLKGIFGEKYRYMFLFDHSSGHDKQRPDGLSFSQMSNLKYGGSQNNNMRCSTIDSEDYLGPYEHPDKLHIGQKQSMIFLPEDSGPFYLNETEKEMRRNTVELNEFIKRKKNKKELVKELFSMGVTPTGGLKKIKKMAKDRGVDLVVQVKKIREGW